MYKYFNKIVKFGMKYFQQLLCEKKFSEITIQIHYITFILEHTIYFVYLLGLRMNVDIQERERNRDPDRWRVGTMAKVNAKRKYLPESRRPPSPPLITPEN